jgi:hypothetical protein
MMKSSREEPSSSVLLDVESFLRKYQQGHVLGKGGFGSVHAGTRRRDHLPVAIKFIRKQKIIAWGTVITFLKPYTLGLTSLNSNAFNVILIELKIDVNYFRLRWKVNICHWSTFCLGR